MSIAVTEEGSLLNCSVSGVLTKAEMDTLWQRARHLIRRTGKIRVLLVARGFKGWKRGDNWEDTTFWDEHDSDVERIAIVADERWKDDVLLFTGKPFRTPQIEFFPESRMADARAWVQT